MAAVVRSYLADLGLVVEDDDAGNLLARLEPSESGTAAADLPLRAHGHGSACGGDSSRSSTRTALSATEGGTILGADNKATVAVLLEAARLLLSEAAAARGRRASLHGQGGGRPPGSQGLRPHAPAVQARLRLRLQRPRGRDRPLGAVREDHRRRLQGPLRARGARPGGGPLGDRRRRARHRRPEARPDRRGDDRQRGPHRGRHGEKRRARPLRARGRSPLA